MARSLLSPQMASPLFKQSSEYPSHISGRSRSSAGSVILSASLATVFSLLAVTCLAGQLCLVSLPLPCSTPSAEWDAPVDVSKNNANLVDRGENQQAGGKYVAGSLPPADALGDAALRE